MMRRARGCSQFVGDTRRHWARRAGGVAAARSALPSPISGSSAGRARAPVQCPAAVLQNVGFLYGAFLGWLAPQASYLRQTKSGILYNWLWAKLSFSSALARGRGWCGGGRLCRGRFLGASFLRSPFRLFGAGRVAVCRLRRHPAGRCGGYAAPPQAVAAPAARLPLFMIPHLLSVRKSFFAILWTILAPLQRDSEKLGNKAHQHPHILTQYRLFRVLFGQPIREGVQLCSAYIRVL